MAEATIKLENGTTITVSGSAEEIARVAMLYGGTSKSVAKPARNAQSRATEQTKPADKPEGEVDLSLIANTINDCDESEALEEHVLDDADTVNKVVMCLYVNDKYFNSKPALTTGEISKILSQLGISVSTSSVSLAISRKAKSFVMQDSVPKKGAIIRYWINRRGKQYFEEVLSGNKVATQKATPRKPRSKPVGTKNTDAEKSTASAPKGNKSWTYKPKYNATLDLHGLDEFSARYQAGNNSEHVVVFLKFLTDQIHLDTVSGDDIHTCFSEQKSKIKLPGSFINTLRNAQNRDHLITYEKGFTNIALTPKGENLFNHELAKRGK